jgi:hypothetical protein
VRPGEEQPLREPLPDADIAVLLLVVSPAFLAVVVRALARGEALGPGATVCGAIFVVALVTAARTWRARPRTGRS